MSRIPTIESALKSSYYDNFINSNAMARAAVKAAGVEPTMELYHQAETIINRRCAEEDLDWRAMAEEIDAMLPKADADGWIQWSGGKRPIPPDTLVDVRFRHGAEAKNCRAKQWGWVETGSTYSIIAYRIANPVHLIPEQDHRSADVSRAVECLFQSFADWSDARQGGNEEGMKKAAAEAQGFWDAMVESAEVQTLKDRLASTDRGERAADDEVERLRGLVKEMATTLEPFAKAYNTWSGGNAQEHFASSVGPANFARATAVLDKAKAAGVV